MYVVVGERCTECYAVVSPSPSAAKPKVPTQSSSLTDRFRRGSGEGSSGWVWGVGKGGVGSRGQRKRERERERRRYIKLRVLTGGGGGGDLLGPPPSFLWWRAALTRGQRFCLADKKVFSCRVSGRGFLEGVFPQFDASSLPRLGGLLPSPIFPSMGHKTDLRCTHASFSHP